ncbi:caspase family protein [Sediminibacterium sp.]|uniref:caspase family protein n=1 Tax=Sediminibacterium sp. TaxID=1917865 RepID=UPI002716676D|nr:caspase family protein [Sediminibacterium sp.]MDO9000486.1 caspase family protein [Bacteroidota bacterium]MDP3146946.1 caspase family protein [Bacteroidota bacterium]MDP3567516.1 caspase family protein [Sediminibacterium sp.]
MKKSLFLFINFNFLKARLIAFFILFLFSGITFSQDYASIYIYRTKKIISTGVTFKVYLDNLEMGQITNGGRLDYKCYKHGKTNITYQVSSEYGMTENSAFELVIEKGKNYYLKGVGKTLILVNEEEGKREFETNLEFRGSVAIVNNRPDNIPVVKSENKNTVPEKKQVQDAPIEIVISSPKLGKGDFKTSASSVKLAGYTISKSNIESVKLNGESLSSDEVGNFSTDYNLKDGLNRITISVLNEKLQETEKTFNIIKEISDVSVATNTDQNKEEITYRGSDPFKGTNVANAAKEIKVGKYYALFIGIDAYSGTWKPLKNAVNDAKGMEAVVKSQYKFDIIKTLYNSQATRSKIIDELDWLVANVKENDNVMIYYSGHGELKKELNKGFWVPVDAKTTSTSNYISNSDIQTFLAAIPSKHTLLVSDACFSGDIFRGSVTSLPFENSEKYYIKTYDLKSRQAISSGGLEPVMDGGKDGHSIFAYYMIQALKNNTSKYYDASQLYNKIKIPVGNNSDQSPEFNPIGKTGDEGGNFIFIKK